MHNILKQLNKKINIIAKIFIILVITIFFRLFYLQIHLKDLFLQRSENNFLRIVKTPSIRGNILDCNNKLLATNRPTINLSWYGTGNKKLDNKQIDSLKKIGYILHQNFLENDVIKKIAYTEKLYKNYVLAKDITFDQLSKIEEQLAGNKNLSIINDFKRYYPQKELGSHILGYLGQRNLDMIGKMGLEKMCEENLKGKEGKILKTINSIGKKLSDEELELASAGQDVKTNIDLDFQKIAEDCFPENKKGIFILLDPKNGAIRALVIRPSFNPEIFLDKLSYENWQNLQNKKPFLNRAFNASYPPASIFKLITISSALENNIISKDTVFTCKGFIRYGNRKYYCINRYGHGELNTQQALAQSCNILFFEIGKKIDIDILANYARRFGLGEKTGVIFNEQEGLVPDREWKWQKKGERWWQGETLSASIGQSFFLTTPVQIARMVGSIFEGFLVKPRLLENENIIKKPLDIKPETLDFLREAMKSAVQEGTGKRISKIKDINAYAKTGTAQTTELKNIKNNNEELLEHAWFVSYFNYKDAEPLVMTILLENVGMSRPAAIFAKEFLVKYKKKMEDKLILE